MKTRKLKTVKVIIAFFITVSFLVQPISSMAFNINLDDSEVDESISENEVTEVIEISTQADIIELANNCSTDSWSIGKKFVLTNDIFIADPSFTGIPYFSGIFDGNGYTIDVNYMTTPGTSYGLFRYVGFHGTVMNLNIEGIYTPTGSKSEIGAVCGVNYGIIQNCSFNGRITGEERIGGICGVNKLGASIISCSNDGVVMATNSTGGICGYNEGTIIGCVNNGDINTEEFENSVDISDVVDISSLNIAQNMTTRNDMGGIAGFSSGVITNSKNLGNIGYMHTGYNVGGIVGRQNGVVALCTNEGEISGRKDVGGIVGQAEPYIESDRLSDELRQTKEDVDALNDTLSGMASTASNTSDQIGVHTDNLYEQYLIDKENLANDLDNVASSISENTPEMEDYRNTIDDAKARIAELEEQERELRENPERLLEQEYDGPSYEDVVSELQYNYRIINNCIYDIENSYTPRDSSTEEMLTRVSDELKNDERTKDVEGIIEAIDSGYDALTLGMRQAVNQAEIVSDDISGNLEKLTYDEGYIEDISSADTAEMQGVVVECINRGKISGDINIGGIAGCMNIEYDEDPEFDLDMTEETDVVLRTTVNCVVIRSNNYGSIHSKKDCAGAVAGLQELGIIYDCEGYGRVSTDSGDYMGGIVGYSVSKVENSYSLCSIEGFAYTGGICGYGYSVENCLSLSSIKANGERKGAIAGFLEPEGERSNNYFYSEKLEGIDSISYFGVAENIPYEEIMAMENVPEGFNTVSVLFMADGKELCEMQIPYGGQISAEDMPEVPVNEGYYARWPEDINSKVITDNTTFEVDYIQWGQSVSGDLLNYLGNPLLIVEGQFYKEANITMQPYNNNFYIDDNHEIRGAYNWQLNDCVNSVDSYIARIYVGEDVNNASIYIIRDNSLEITESYVDGSYLVTTLDKNQSYAVVVSNSNYGIYVIATCICTALLVVAVIIFVVIRKKKKISKNNNEK